MKKYLIFLIGVISLLGINTVKADTVNKHIELINSNYTYEENIEFFNIYKKQIGVLYGYIYEHYNTNFSNIYPYYDIYISHENGCVKNCTNGLITMHMHMYQNKPTYNINNDYEDFSFSADKVIQISYDIESTQYIFPIVDSNSNVTTPFSFVMYYRNYNLILNMDDNNSLIYYPYSTNTEYLELHNGDTIPSFQDISKLDIMSDPNSINTSYVEVNLNDYSYIALSLKDYSNIPKDNYSTFTYIYTKGQLCITPVYNYGITEKKDVISNTQVQGCSKYYNVYTSVRIYILKTDVQNKAIYYIKAYDKSRPNSIKVDSAKFNISYITEENKDNPEVTINGKVYPTLPYDSLTDTSTKSEDEGYISGVSCPLGDLNCYNEYNSSNTFDNLFDKPLEMLKSVWTAITSIFAIITEFILLLPPTMQGFLYTAFGLGAALAIIKILII